MGESTVKVNHVVLVRRPNGLMEGHCNASCNEPTSAVIEIGGGIVGSGSTITQSRLCTRHAKALSVSLRAFLS